MQALLHHLAENTPAEQDTAELDPAHHMKLDLKGEDFDASVRKDLAAIPPSPRCVLCLSLPAHWCGLYKQSMPLLIQKNLLLVNHILHLWQSNAKQITPILSRMCHREQGPSRIGEQELCKTTAGRINRLVTKMQSEFAEEVKKQPY